jgi:hypothetical protein
LAQIKQEQTPLIDYIIARFIDESDSGLRSQLSEVIRVLLDTSGMEGSEGLVTHSGGESDVDEFLNVFYEKYMAKLVAPVLALESSCVIKDNGTSDSTMMFRNTS